MSCPCETCNRPRHPDLAICTHHAWCLERDLADTPALVRELELTLSRQRAGTTSAGGRSAEKPLPLDPRAGDTLRALRAVLATWARTSGLHVRASDHTAGIALALHINRHQLVLRIDAHQAVADITGACRDGWAVVQPNSRGRIPLPDACPEAGCKARMWATMHDVDDPRPNLVWCEGTERHEWRPEQWLRLGHRLGYGRTA